MGARKVDSVDLAKYILAQQGPMPHLKLQKLLYYVEAWHLAIFGDSIVADKFKAWMHGPVSTKVWHEFKTSSPLLSEISVPSNQKSKVQLKITSELMPEQLSLIDDVLAEYGPLNAYQLEALTHSELPWLEARNGISPTLASNATISKDTMKKFYRKRLYGSDVATETK